MWSFRQLWRSADKHPRRFVCLFVTESETKGLWGFSPTHTIKHRTDANCRARFAGVWVSRNPGIIAQHGAHVLKTWRNRERVSEKTELFKGLRHETLRDYFTTHMHETHKNSGCFLLRGKKKSMSMETRLAGFLGVCARSQLGLHYARSYEWVGECEWMLCFCARLARGIVGVYCVCFCYRTQLQPPFLCGIAPILLCGGTGVKKYVLCVCLVFLRGNFLPLEAALVLRNFLSGQTALPE